MKKQWMKDNAAATKRGEKRVWTKKSVRQSEGMKIPSQPFALLAALMYRFYAVNSLEVTQ